MLAADWRGPLGPAEWARPIGPAQWARPWAWPNGPDPMGAAQQGTRFDAAYTVCPVCVPARASFATGKYVHQIGAWDNATPFDGTQANWHALLRERGHQTVSIGKLHF